MLFEIMSESIAYVPKELPTVTTYENIGYVQKEFHTVTTYNYLSPYLYIVKWLSTFIKSEASDSVLEKI